MSCLNLTWLNLFDDFARWQTLKIFSFLQNLQRSVRLQEVFLYILRETVHLISFLYWEKKATNDPFIFLMISFFNYVYLVDHIDDSEKLRPEELNQQTIEALVAESNLVLMILHILLWLCLWGWNKCWHQFYAYWSL